MWRLTRAMLCVFLWAVWLAIYPFSFFSPMFRQVQIDDVGRFVFGQTKGRDTRDQHVVEVLQEIEGP